MIQIEKEYAEALFLLAKEEDQIDSSLQFLKAVRTVVLESPEYLDFLSSPAIGLRERLQAIEESFGNFLPEFLLSFLKLLCENGRMRSLLDCIEEFDRLVMVYLNQAVAVITSAVVLNDVQKSALCNKLSAMVGKQIQPLYQLDPSLLGGMKIELEGKTYDGSLKHRLHDVKDVMIG